MKLHSLPIVLTGAFALCAGVSLCLAEAGKVPKVGDKAPLVTGKNQDGKMSGGS